MPRIVVVSASPLLAEGLAAALRDMADCDVRIGRNEDDADAWVLAGDELVVRGAQGASAQLAADASAPRLRAAVAAVLQGLSVRESPWLGDVQDAPEHEPLTPRELEVRQTVVSLTSDSRFHCLSFVLICADRADVR